MKIEIQPYIAIALILQLCQYVFSDIYWEVKSDSFELGKNLTLFCNTSSVQDKCEQCQKRWYGGKNLQLLSFDGTVLNASKYEFTRDSDGFGLIIKNLTKDDINQTYSCSFGFNTYTKKLQRDSDLKIFWQVKSSPIVFGQSLTLYCNISSVKDRCRQCSKRWYGGTNLQLLYYDGSVIDHSKYEVTFDNQGFSLKIKNLTEDDINQVYSCSFGFYECGKQLQLNEAYERQPTRETTYTEYYLNRLSILNVEVDFIKVHPRPNCTIHFNNDDLSSKLIRHDEKAGLFYNVNFEFHHDITQYQCVGDLNVACNIGTQNITVISKKIDFSCNIQPVEAVTHTSYFIDRESILNVLVDFIKIQHIPFCTLYFNNNNLSSELFRKSQQEGNLYNVSFAFHYDIKSYQCAGDLNVACNIGTTNITLISKKIDHSCNEVQPAEETTHSSYFIDRESMLNVLVEFTKVKSIPNCAVYFNNDNLSSKLVRLHQADELFYKVNFEFYYDITPYQCAGNLLVDCQIGEKNVTVIAKKIDYSCNIQPTKEITHTSFFIDRESTLNVQVEFTTMLSKPHCSLYFDNDNLSSKFFRKEKKRGKFYNVSYEFHQDIRLYRCAGDLKVFCQRGTKNITVMSKKIDYFCKNSSTIKQSSTRSKIVLYLSFIFIFIVIAVGFYRYKANKVLH